jgi:hypothetical protein
MFAQPSTEAFKPTTKLPETADPDAGGLVEGGLVGGGLVGGEGGLGGADRGLFGVDGDAGEGAGLGVGETGADGVDAGWPGCDCDAGDGVPAPARGAWRIALRVVDTQMRVPRRTRQTTRVEGRFAFVCRADASAVGADAKLTMINAARR